MGIEIYEEIRERINVPVAIEENIFEISLRQQSGIPDRGHKGCYGYI